MPGAIAALGALMTGLFLLPVVAGLAGTLLPAFGFLPAAGGHEFSLAPWRELFAYPGLRASLRLTLTTGFAATLLALGLAAALCASVQGRARLRAGEALLAPLLAAPHASVAIGLAFVLAPSGWVVRLVSPWLTGWSVPPDVATVQDPWGIALVLGLLVKEVPFLVLVMLGALHQIPAAQQLRVTASLGYSPGTAWTKIIFPQVYARIRLPVYAVLAYSLSVVDMALVLAPGNPGPLSLVALRWFTAPDVTRYLPAAAAAVLQLGLVIAAIALWRAGEGAARAIGQRWIMRGARAGACEPGVQAAGLAAGATLALGGAALLAMALWSLASTWRFPDALPSHWSLVTWISQSHSLALPLANTLLLGATTMLAGLILALAWFEACDRHGRRWNAPAINLVCLPLLAPQIAFLFGLQVPLVRVGLDGTFLAVAWSHLLLVFPYMLIALADPWAALDRRYARAAASLGASPLRILLAVKLPVLLAPVLRACAVGFAASAAQYLPTLFAGAGRVPTLATEAIALASGADRRIVGTFAFLLALAPLLVYLAALAIPALALPARRAPGRRA